MFTGGAVNYDKKKQSVSLLTMIKHESPDLYHMIGDLCLDGTFRSQRYQNTFLMPSKALVKHIEQLVEKDEDVKAIDAIRSLLLKGHLSKEDFKKDAKIGTLQFGSHVLAHPEEVAQHISSSKKSLIATRDGSFATVVFEYKSDKPPQTVEGKSGGLIPVGSMRGGASNQDAEIVKKITKRLMEGSTAETIVGNFFKAVAAVLAILQDDKEKIERYNRAKFYLAANPILSWFFLTMPGRKDALISASELKDFNWEVVTEAKNTIYKAEKAGDYELSRQFLTDIKTQRSTLVNHDKACLVKEINNSYHELVKLAKKYNSIDSNLAEHVDLKMLMDELRFLHEGSVVDIASVEDSLHDLGMINWAKPKDCKIICDPSTYEQKIKSPEAFLCGPHTFVKSIYFMYVPLTEKVETQLMNAMNGGAILGGNPSTISNVVFTGGAARKQLQKSDMKLSSLVRVLSKSQREALKAML